ncbi:MAG: ATP-binding protein [Gammaproteobacteria bacterium]|nr:ATP-binding protein [Gammaproteobacteria bacterium]
MIEYKRNQLSTLLSRLGEKPRFLIALIGPRQTGKTTLVKQALREFESPSRYISADTSDPIVISPSPVLEQNTISLSAKTEIVNNEMKNEEWLIRQWDEARISARNSQTGFVLVIDEIKEITNWSKIVKGLWDQDRYNDLPLHVVLLSSSPLLFQQGLTESLAGRFEIIRFTHWSFLEMVNAFDFSLEEYIFFGGYPGSASFIQDHDRWNSYISNALIEPNIERDILAFQRVDKPALLKQLFMLGAEYSGQILSYNKMLGQLQDAGNTTTLARYLDLLTTIGLMTGLQNYSNKPFRRKSSSPKLNVLNTALMTVVSGYSFNDARADRTHWGRLVESAVGAHLFNTGMSNCRLYYWRNENYEVDFVLSRGPKTIAFEVKSGQYRKQKMHGLGLFSKKFNVSRSIVIGEEGDIPLSEFLSIPAFEWAS